MTEFSQQLSAYLDGELDAATAAEVEARLASDTTAQAELDALIQADGVAQVDFAAQLDDPVPFALAQTIQNTPLPERPANIPAAPTSRPIRGTLAASLLVFVIGGAGGYLVKDQLPPPVQTAGWLADIADYHAVYAAENRHLVEVGAEESEHIETWLANVVGTSFHIPDLSEFGLTFEGGRLLVANGKPVAQLMYLLPDGTVVALCLQDSNRDVQGAPAFREQTINGFDFVSWSADGADYVVIGPDGFPDLAAIAAAASVDI
jgi:anti-sigma factor RsiW